MTTTEETVRTPETDEAQARLLQRRAAEGVCSTEHQNQSPSSAASRVDAPVFAEAVTLDPPLVISRGTCRRCLATVAPMTSAIGPFMPAFCDACERDTDGDPYGAMQREDAARHRASEARERSRVTPLFRSKTWGNFTADDDNRAAIRAVRNVVFENGDGVLIVGRPGTGKSHLAAALGNEIIDAGRLVVHYVDVPTLMLRIKSQIGRAGHDPVDVIDEIKRVPLLILDDLGMGKPSEWTQETLYALINHRREHFLPVIATTEFSLTTLADRIGERCVSRLQETCVAVELTGNDRRVVNKRAGGAS